MRASTAWLFVSLLACASHEEARGPREIARAPGAIEPRAARVTVDVDHQAPCACLPGHGPDTWAIDIFITDERDEQGPQRAYIHLEGERGETLSSVGSAWVVVGVDERGRAWPYDGKGAGVEIPGAIDGALIAWTADRMIVARGREVRVHDPAHGFAVVTRWSLPAPARALAAGADAVAVASAMGVAIHGLDGTPRERLALADATALAWNAAGDQLSVELPGPTTVTYQIDRRTIGE